MKKNKEEPPVPKHDLAAYAMEFVGSDLFHFDGNIYLIVVDFFSGYLLVKNLGKTSSTAKIIKRMTKWFNLLGYPRKCRADGGGEYRLAFQQWCATITAEVLASRERLSWFRATARLIADKAKQFDLAKSRASFLSWLHEGPAKTIGRLHQLTRVSSGWIPTPVGLPSAES